MVFNAYHPRVPGKVTICHHDVTAVAASDASGRPSVRLPRAGSSEQTREMSAGAARTPATRPPLAILPAASAGAASAPARVAPSLSIVLDVTRFAFALTVVAGHWTQGFFGIAGPPTLMRWAVRAVGGFFVLSGFTIRLLAQRREGFHVGAYFVERLSRLWSVVLPALALTVVCDFVSWRASPAFYLGCWPIVDGLAGVMRGLLANALFVSQVWSLDVAPLSNSPFWSLGYEMPFYVIYGAWMAVARPARRWLIVAGLGFAFGPQISMLLLLWLLGVGIFEALRAFDHLVARRRRTAVALAAAGALAVLVGFAALPDIEGPSAKLQVFIFTKLFPAIGIPVGRVGDCIIVGALLFAPLLLVAGAIAALFPGRDSPAVHRWAGRARRLGEVTFPLYLMHFPLFVAITAVCQRLQHVRKPGENWLWFTLVCALAFAATRPAATLKVWLRTRLRPLLAPSSS